MKRIFTLIILFAAIPSWVCASGKSSWNTFNRLFTTHNQRLVLDRLRAHYNPGEKTPIRNRNYADRSLNVDTIPDRQLRLKGIIKRSNGRQSVWLGDRRFDVGPHSSGNVSVTNDKHPGARLRVPGKSYFIQLKPGQTYLIDSNRVMENFSVPETVITRSNGRYKIKAK